ncbi:MAG: hypothetical protein HFJ25_06020 [Clostridia bacterium]|nr:hypothetical protein [Clostridia bacterium]
MTVIPVKWIVLFVIGTGARMISGPCTVHSISGKHYYCTSSSEHGNNVSQYHK